MNPAEILQALQDDGVADGIELFEGPQDAALVVPAARLHDVCRHLKTAHHLFFEQCVMVTGTHMIEQRDKDGNVVRAEGFELIYHLRSLRNHLLLGVKVRLPAEDPHVDTVSDLWRAANWHERETWDLVGIRFDGHPDLRRILLPDDWEGHPLRKDYVFPTQYQGISLEVDPPWPTP